MNELVASARWSLAASSNQRLSGLKTTANPPEQPELQALGGGSKIREGSKLRYLYIRLGCPPTTKPPPPPKTRLQHKAAVGSRRQRRASSTPPPPPSLPPPSPHQPTNCCPTGCTCMCTRAAAAHPLTQDPLPTQCATRRSPMAVKMLRVPPSRSSTWWVAEVGQQGHSR